MGIREIWHFCCPNCGFVAADVPYAPSCGITLWKCPQCKHVLNLKTWELCNELCNIDLDNIDHEMKLDYDSCG